MIIMAGFFLVRTSIADHDGRTSYEMFLQILYACLKDDLHGNQLWRQMKSRLIQNSVEL